MSWKPGQSGNPRGRLTEKIFADAVRIAVNREDAQGRRKLQLIVDKMVELAVEGESWAIQHVADRLDGKPAQESMVTIDDKRDAQDWTRDELVAVLNDAKTGSNGAAKANGRGGGPDSVH